MKKHFLRVIFITTLLSVTFYSKAQNWQTSGNSLSGVTNPKLGSTDAYDVGLYTNDILRMNITQNGLLGVGIDQPRGWFEFKYCSPQGQDDNGLIITRNYCNNHIGVDAGLPDRMGGGVAVWDPGTPPEANNFVVPFSFRTGNTTNVTSPLLNNDAAPLFWVRKQSPNGIYLNSGSDKFDTKFIVLPDGGVGINIVQPRAALDVRGSNAKNHPAAIIGSRALGTHYIDPMTGTLSYFTQQVHFVPILKENGYNRIVQDDDQGMFFTDGQGNEGANSQSAFVLAPWAEDDDPDIGGMRMDANGNTEFHGTLRATKMNLDIQWWSDFVFDDEYELLSLEEVETYINENKHLPNMPSEVEVLENGVDVANMQAIQQQKIEELTLYIIQLKKEMENLKTELELLKQ